MLIKSSCNNDMKIIYDDIIYSIQKSGGISVYWNILERFIPVDIRFVYKNCEKNIFYIKRPNEVRVSKNLFLERYRNINFKIKSDFSYIFHSSYYRYCKNRNAQNITTVHDFTYEIFRTDLKSKLHKIQKKNAVMHSDGVICISENTKKDLYRYYPDYKGKVTVIYHGYDNNIFSFRNKEMQKRTNNVIFVGARSSYKGFNFTLVLLKKIKKLNLIIIGGGELSEEEKILLENTIPNRYEKLGYVSNGALAELYNYSFALFYPSEYEGFGFPVIEAQACGCPVICQKKSSIPEVSGDKCIYVDSDNIEQSLNNVNKLFNGDEYKKLQNEGLENVKRFSWEKCIRETIEFYNYVLTS